MAAYVGDAPAVRLLLQLGHPTETLKETHDRYGGTQPDTTALLEAIMHHHTDSALALLAGGTDPARVMPGSGATPLLCAAPNAELDVVRRLLLVHKVPPVNPTVAARRHVHLCSTPLAEAVLYLSHNLDQHRCNVTTKGSSARLERRHLTDRFMQMAEVLVQAGATINDPYDDTDGLVHCDALRFALRAESTAMVRWLLARGAAVTQPPAEMRGPWWRAFTQRLHSTWGPGVLVPLLHQAAAAEAHTAMQQQQQPATASAEGGAVPTGLSSTGGDGGNIDSAAPPPPGDQQATAAVAATEQEMGAAAGPAIAAGVGARAGSAGAAPNDPQCPAGGAAAGSAVAPPPAAAAHGPGQAAHVVPAAAAGPPSPTPPPLPALHWYPDIHAVPGPNTRTLSPVPWTPGTHWLYPPGFRAAVRTLLLANRRCEGRMRATRRGAPLPRLPPDVARLVVAALAREPLEAWWTQQQLEQMAEGLRVKNDFGCSRCGGEHDEEVHYYYGYY